MAQHTKPARVLRWEEGREPAEFADELATEEPLEIRFAGEPVSVTMRTPGHDIELVAGMLLTEGLVQPGMPLLLRQEHPNIVNVASETVSGPDNIRRTSIMSTSCGICGKGSIEAIHQHFPPLENDAAVSRAVLSTLTANLQTAQQVFSRTGGLHAAGIFDSAGRLIIAREDVGRHNAVDKVIGNALLRGLVPLAENILFVSGRASFEILQKALGARIPIIAAVSAPSSLAVDFAAESGQTLVGFLREGRCNVYSHPERVLP